MGDEYVHGYTTDEQERLLAQAEHWRDELILSGTALPDGAMGWVVHKAGACR